MHYYILNILTGEPVTKIGYDPFTVGIPFSNRVIKFSNIKEAKIWMKQKSKFNLIEDMSSYEIIWNPHKE